MMESKVSIEGFVQSARRRRPRVALKGCPHCGGDVRLARDIYGAYLQCLQCSREIQPGALAPSVQRTPAAAAASPQVAELKVA